MEISQFWIAHALRSAYKVATASPDISTQVGAICYTKDLEFISAGYNDFTKGVQILPERLERPLKYSYTECAERNAIFAATRKGRPPAVMVAPWAACTPCARAIVQCGIKILIRHKQASDRTPDHWKESIEFADELMYDGGLEIIDFDGVLGAHAILHCGKLWTP